MHASIREARGDSLALQGEKQISELVPFGLITLIVKFTVIF